MPGENPFDNFEFPRPVELEPLEPYAGGGGNYGGYEEAYGGEGGDMPRLLANDWDKGGAGGDLRAFRPYSLQQKSGGDWSCYITAGLVLDNHILNMAQCESSGATSSGEVEDAVEIRIPTINQIGIIDPQCSSGWTRPELILPGIPCFIYCAFKTDNHGNITLWDEDESTGGGDFGEFVKIIALTEEKKSTNHVPPSPEDQSGRGGEYYWILAEICSGSSGSAEISHRHQSNILWPGEFGISNDSAAQGANVYRKFDKCTGDYKLRKILGCYALRDVENLQYIELNFEAENIGTPTGSNHPDQPVGYNGAAVYDDSAGESCGGKARFRKIIPSSVASEPQILPIQVGPAVEIRGNGFDGSIKFDHCDQTYHTITFVDGLAVGIIDQTGADVQDITHYGECDSSGEYATPAP